MSAKGNQIRDKMIRLFPKTDGQKLAGLEHFLHQKYPTWDVHIEPFMIFKKGEDEFVEWNNELTIDQVQTFDPHPPDILIIREGGMLVLELDGPIHDKKTEKTDKRNKRYELNDIPYIVVNETDLKFELGLAKSAPLTQDQINEAYAAKITNLSL